MHRVEPRALRRTDWTATAQPAMLRQVSGVGRVLHRWHRALATRSAVPMDRCLHRTVTRSNTVLELLGVRGPTPCRCICSTRRSQPPYPRAATSCSECRLLTHILWQRPCDACSSSSKHGGCPQRNVRPASRSNWRRSVATGVAAVAGRARGDTKSARQSARLRQRLVLISDSDSWMLKLLQLLQRLRCCSGCDCCCCVLIGPCRARFQSANRCAANTRGRGRHASQGAV